MSQFSTNEAVSLEKRIELPASLTRTNPENINYLYEIERCAKWILENEYNKVCMQFPDLLLPDAAQVVCKIENIVGRKVYILADTAYESCCIDYTAAKHVLADAIIHFGPTCFSKAENIIPCLKIYEKFPIDVVQFCESVREKFSANNCDVCVINTPYLHKIEEVKTGLNELIPTICSVEEILDISNTRVLYLGANDRKLLNINLTCCPKQLYYYNPEESKNKIQNYEQDTKILKRRNFLIEKIKDSNTVGILISTLAVRNYLKIIERIKTLAKVHSKKYYIISVGKPTVAKLANFPEVDVFAVIGCAMNEIYENRDFYKPIVTPYDLEAALNPKLEHSQFSYDFNKFLTEDNKIDPSLIEELRRSDVSLLTGQIRYQEESKREDEANDKSENKDGDDEKKIAVRSDGKLQLSENFGAGFLAGRSWKGLEQNLGKDQPQLAAQGRKGIAQSYQNEMDPS